MKADKHQIPINQLNDWGEMDILSAHDSEVTERGRERKEERATVTILASLRSAS